MIVLYCFRAVCLDFFGFPKLQCWGTVSTFVIPFCYGPGTVINYGSGSAKVRNYIMVPVPRRQKVTVPTIPFPVPQNCILTGPDVQPWGDAGEMHADGALPGDDRAGSGRGARHGRPRRTPSGR
jgi:hypothetical protein